VLTINERLGDLSSFLFELTDQLQPMAVAKNISLTLDVPHLTVDRYFDADVVEKIIYNLVSNAIKFTPEHGHVVVNLSVDGSDAKIVSISVRDNGIGIAAKDQDRVFNRFFRSAVSESNSGVGLGLSIVKDLTALCGGTVTVSSVIGKGSEFIVALPLRQGIQNAVGQGVADTGDINGSQPIVLVIEDNHDMVECVKSVLSESGYNVHVAMAGKDGVEKANEIIPDVVITDLMLPDIDGYEVCRTIKGQPATEHIPVIMLTARTSAEKKLEGIESGVDIYISKPFNPAELKGCISNLLAMRTRIREQYNQPQGEKEEPITDNYAGLRQSENVFVARVFALIDKNLSDEEFSVDTLAREMFLSRAQFHRKLKMLTGYAASDLIRRIRLEKAFELLKNDAGSVTEIAFMTGFNSQPYFTKCFTQQYGYSPKEVKK
jgi:DNA-binding response OmpR family regulator